MKEVGVSPEDKVICFGQLYGMCDYITFPLGKDYFMKDILHRPGMFSIAAHLLLPGRIYSLEN